MTPSHLRRARRVAALRGRALPRRGHGLLLVAFAVLAAAHGCSERDARGAPSADAEPVPTVRPRVRVRTEPARRVALDAQETVTGIVRAFHKATVPAETQGRVVERAVERGAQLERGDVIARLDASRFELELRRAEATLRAREHDLAHAQREFERGEQLAKRNAISQQRRDDLQHALDAARDARALARVARDTARRTLADAQIRAPFAGSVDDLHVDVGDFVAPGAPVATLVSLERARIFAGVTAAEAGRLAPGLRTRASFDALGGADFAVELRSVARIADPSDGTYAVELWLDHADARLRDGLVAQVALPEAAGETALVAPRAALLRIDGQPHVFVVDVRADAPRAQLRRVRTGRTTGEWIEVVDGLREGETVVIDGHFALRDGSEVAVAAAPAAPPAQTGVAAADPAGL